MKTDIQKQSNKINAIVMIVVLVFTVLVAGSVAIALNADKLGIGSEPAEPTITPEDLRPDHEFTYNETNIRYALGIDFLNSVYPDKIDYVKSVPVSDVSTYELILLDDNSIEYSEGLSYFLNCNELFDGEYFDGNFWTFGVNFDFHPDHDSDINYSGECDDCYSRIRLNYPMIKGSGFYLKLIDDDSAQSIIVGGYDCFNALDTFIQMEEYDGLVRFRCSPLDFSTTDRSVFDPDNLYPEYDRAEFYSYGDIYFETYVYTSGLNFSHIGEEAFNSAPWSMITADRLYYRFRIY